MRSVTIGSVELPEGLVGDAGWWFNSIVGWDDVTESKTKRDARPQAHGDWQEDYDYRQGAAVSVSGAYKGLSRDGALLAKDALKAIGAGSVLECVVDDSDDERGPTSREVSINRLTIPDDRGRSMFTFTIDMLAADPFRYGPAVVTSTGLASGGTGYTWPAVWDSDWGTGGDPGQLVTSNPGTQDAYSLFWVTGGLAAGFSLRSVEDGREIRFERPIPLGSTVYVDPATGNAWIDDPDNDVSGFLTRTEWWATPPQSTRTVQLNGLGAVTGTPRLFASTRPTYI